MDIISKFRSEGKTTDLVKLSAEKNIPILSVLSQNAYYIKEVARKLNLSIPEPILFGFQPLPQEVLIDNLELFLTIVLRGTKVHTATMSKKITFTKREIAEKIGLTPDDFTIVEN